MGESSPQQSFVIRKWGTTFIAFFHGEEVKLEGSFLCRVKVHDHLSMHVD